jgi:hypothetical protein
MARSRKMFNLQLLIHKNKPSRKVHLWNRYDTVCCKFKTLPFKEENYSIVGYIECYSDLCKICLSRLTSVSSNKAELVALCMKLSDTLKYLERLTNKKNKEQHESSSLDSDKCIPRKAVAK